MWADSDARRFTIFVFVSMLAYSAQDLILEPFAGSVFGMTPGASTRLSGVQHGGVLLGMLLVALSGLVSARYPRHRLAAALGSLRGWTVFGCVASAVAMLALTGCAVPAPPPKSMARVKPSQVIPIQQIDRGVLIVMPVDK